MTIGAYRALALAALMSLIGQFAYCQTHETARMTMRSEVVANLAGISGNYAWSDETKQYEYSEKAKLEEILSKQDAKALVPVLVECLDDRSLSNSLLQGKKVTVGVVCYQALTQTIYYEPNARNGDIAANWPGHILPNATLDELRAAKNAWLKVLKTKAYTFL